MTPRQARAARAMLGLDMKTVCALANIGKRTLTEFEAGSRAINSATESKIKAFYISRGLAFTAPEDGESVRFGRPPECADESTYVVRSKSEYVDLFGALDVAEKLTSLTESLKSLSQRETISQSIIMSAQKRSGLNQKELASQIDCTASFINAIAVGKKSVPISYSEKIQIFFNQDQVSIRKALRQEKIIEKFLAQSIRIHEDLLNAWRSLYD